MDVKDKRKPAKPAAGQTFEGFTDEERAAMRARAQELKAAPRRGKADGEGDVLAKIAEMTGQDRALAERVHAIVKATAPQLESKTWYGMPAYALNGKTVCFFQNGSKFKTRYSTLGFSDTAKLDEGNMWPNSYALKSLTPADEKRIAELLKKAIG